MVPPPFLLVPDLRVPGVRPANEHIACQKRRQRTMMSLLDKGSGVYLEIMTGNVIDRSAPSGPSEGLAGRPPWQPATCHSQLVARASRDWWHDRRDDISQENGSIAGDETAAAWQTN